MEYRKKFLDGPESDWEMSYNSDLDLYNCGIQVGFYDEKSQPFTYEYLKHHEDFEPYMWWIDAIRTPLGRELLKYKENTK